MKYILSLCLMVTLAWSVSAQKMMVLEGSLMPLLDQKTITAEFTYDNMLIGKKGETEEAYVTEKKKSLNEKEAGKGDTWSKAWIEDRKTRFEPQFVELFSKHAGIVIANSEPNTYTLVFKTLRTEPGWNVGVMRASAYIDAEVWIVETANKDKIIAKVSIKNSPGRDGMGYDFDTGYRIQEAYAKAGKELGQLIDKQRKKK
jgi:hypothetical protein